MIQSVSPLKKCGKCQQEKEYKFFYHDSRHNKLTSRCKQCMKEYSVAYARDNPEKKKEWFGRWLKKNYGKVLANNAKRKAAKRKRTPPWLTEEHHRQIEVEYALAVWCSKVMNVPYHVDHMVPLQGKTVCGLHVPWNLQVIPASDNLSKYNSFIE